MSDPIEAMARVEAQLLAPGGVFETEEITAFGERYRAFALRAPNLRALLAASAEHGDAEYMIFRGPAEERRFTYREHLGLVASTARALQERYGVERGDRVAILGANSPEWIVTFWATVSLGAIAVGLNGWWTEDEILYGLRDSDPKVLIGDRKRLARLGNTDPGVPVVVMEADFEKLSRAHPKAALPDTPIESEDPALILYTSGTTGRPKGVVHAHLNVCCQVALSFFHGARIAAVHPPAPDERGEPLPTVVLVTSPLFHVSGLHAAAITALAGGATTVWPIGRFDPALVLRIIEEERVTSWGYTATVLHRLLHHPDIETADLSTLRVIGGGGSQIPTRLQEEARERMPTAERTLGVGYGLTEATAFTTLNAAAELERYPESAGRVLPTVEVEIRDAKGNALPEGHEGEICIRGPLVMKEYWRDPEATKDAIAPGRWLRTGDVGTMKDGRLYLASRKRDMIIRGGENVYPVEIEHRIEAHPDIAEAAVMGVEHEELGQEVKAVVVPRGGVTPSPDELTKWVGETLAYYKVPAHWEIREAPLPRNATGKVLKHVLSGDERSTFIEE